jgi:anti-sigma-K factor RskA
MGRLTPEEQRELLGAYALGAVDDDERVEVAELVLADTDARAELHMLQLGVAWLDHASTGAPMHVWRAIEAEIAGDVRSIGDETAPAVVTLTTRRRVGRLVAVAAAVIALALGSIGVLATRGDRTSPSVAALAAEARHAPGSDVAVLRTTDGSRAATVVVTAGGRGYVVWSAPPAAVASDRTYQLWVLTAGGPRSAGVLGAAPRDARFRAGSNATGVAVTVEPRGGSPAPTGPVVATAQLA